MSKWYFVALLFECFINARCDNCKFDASLYICDDNYIFINMDICDFI